MILPQIRVPFFPSGAVDKSEATCSRWLSLFSQPCLEKNAVSPLYFRPQVWCSFHKTTRTPHGPFQEPSYIGQLGLQCMSPDYGTRHWITVHVTGLQYTSPDYSTRHRITVHVIGLQCTSPDYSARHRITVHVTRLQNTRPCLLRSTNHTPPLLPVVPSSPFIQ